MMNKNEIIDLVLSERERQDRKWGTSFPNRQWDRWLAILMEEVGEAAEAILSCDEREARMELIQVMAVCMSALEHGGKMGVNDG